MLENDHEYHEEHLNKQGLGCSIVTGVTPRLQEGLDPDAMIFDSLFGGEGP